MKKFTKIAQKISKKVLELQFKESENRYYISFEISSAGNMIELRVHDRKSFDAVESYSIYSLKSFSFSDFQNNYTKEYVEKIEANFLYQIKEMEKLLNKYAKNK